MMYTKEKFLQLLNKVKTNKLEDSDQRMVEDFEDIYENYILQGREVVLLIYMSRKLEKILEKVNLNP